MNTNHLGISIGTDCSGIEAPIEALKQLNIPFQHKWACEIDKFARQSILANYTPEILYEDITQRDHSALPDVDIYVCGFPCQSFSLMGKKRGTQDPRSNIMLHCIEVIKKKLPPVFILENVKNFKFIEKGKPYNHLINELTGIVDETGEEVYNLYPDIYNTKDYGIPQNRERIYIIGIKQDIQTKEYVKPQGLPMRPLEDFITDKTVYKHNLLNSNIIKNIKSISLKCDKLGIVTGDNYYFPILHCCPTLNRHCSQFYIYTLNRRILSQECLLLQGFTTTFIQAVSKTQLCKQAGNSMSVNVLKVIYNTILKCTILQDILM